MMIQNIEALSLSELRYVAHKQGIDDAHTLDRDDLVEALEELFDEMESNPNSEGAAYSPSSQQRFLSSLVDHQMEDSGLLPGVQPIPESYCETSIHLLFKDPYWAHAYWSICNADFQKLEQNTEAFTFFIKVTIHETINGEHLEESFDIDIEASDTNWNINLPLRGRTYSVSLHYRDENGNVGMLCQSASVTTPKSHWLEHTKELGANSKEFLLLFSSLVTKGGVMVESPMLREMVEKLNEQVEGSDGA